tara:strand:+ start:59 stop:697 length:639 start_codon:yes stop_codon:yes gene_type:complete
MSNLIEIYNLNKSFFISKKVRVLKKISYKFKSGKIYSLMGPSGSGKSTLLNLLSLIDRPSSGSIKINGKQINFNETDKNDILRANKIGIIYQQDNLLPDFTAFENIYLASLAGGNNKELSKSKTELLLKKVGLLNRSEHYPSQLSGGEKQRISIARALINDPQIILADEPTGSLDLDTAKVIFDILKKQINSNRIIIFATHNRFFATHQIHP